MSQGLYVRRNLTPASAKALTEWARAQGFSNLVPEHELHATIVYSRTPVLIQSMGGNVAASSGGRSVERLGDEGAVVLHIEAPALAERWKEAIAAGASWEYDGYRPHVTITYDAGGMDLSTVEPFAGDIVFGPEIHEPLNENWAEEKGLRTIEASALRFVPALQAMALDIPKTPGHPNKHPFKGILTRLDEPSDRAPEGSGGRRVVLTKAAAQKALPTLLGMAVNFDAGMSDHNVKAKVGIIDKAEIIGDAIHIEGFLYAADFPDEVRRIHSARGQLGFSWEIQNVRVADATAAPLQITDCVFTGAAILYKDKAAYQTTSLAAQAEENTMEKEALEQLKTIAESVGKLNETITGLSDRVGKMEAAAADEAKDKKIKELEEQLSSLNTQVKDLKAAGEKNAKEPERKTLNPAVTALLAKAGITAPEGDKKLSTAEVDKALKDSGLDPVKRIEVKAALSNNGLVAA